MMVRWRPAIREFVDIRTRSTLAREIGPARNPESGCIPMSQIGDHVVGAAEFSIAVGWSPTRAHRVRL